MSSRLLVPGFIIMALSANICSAHYKTRKVVKQLKADIGYLASDELEGRHTGSEGEKKARIYIKNRYKDLGIPAYKEKYAHPFQFIYGKKITELSSIKLNGNALVIKDDVFPVPFSSNGNISGEALPDVYEQETVWIMPLYASKEEADDVHFDWEKVAYDKIKDAAKHGAKAILFYDKYDAKYPPVYNSKSDYETTDIPAAFLTNKAYKTHIANASNNIRIELNVDLKKVEMTGTNVAAYIDNHAKYTVIIGAHYDHLGYGEDGNSLMANAKKEKQIHNGADDNASGTAALMQMAGWIKENNLHNYNYLFVHFSGEELGLFGSKAFVKDEKIDSSTIAYMINMDMVGRLNDSTHALSVGGFGTSSEWAKIIDKSDERFKIILDSAGIGPSDHTSFYNAGIPVLFFFTGSHRDYHKPSDDADKINYTGEASVIDYIYTIVAKMETEPKPSFITTKSSTLGKTRFKVTLGIMPDYAYQEAGVRADGVTDGRPAAKAGIKAGDIIIQLGDNKVQGMQSYMEALGKFAPGDKTTVTIQRDGKEIKMPIEFNKN